MVTALVVTYGDRWHLLKQVLDRLSQLPLVSGIILVDNGSNHLSLAAYYLTTYSKEADLIDCGKNLGSAGAYKKGLERFLANSRERYVWLLDDDNLPEPGALEFLIEKALEGNAARPVAYLSLRPDRPYLVKATRGMALQKLFPTVDSYLGFNLFKTTSNPLGRDSDCKVFNCIAIPMAPYGGLLLPRTTIEVVGVPLEDFFLYGDDFEFTYRITRRGGCICLVKESVVSDIDASWVSTGKKIFKPRILFQDDFRSRYAIRNAVYLSSNVLRRNAFVFSVNEFLVNAYYLASSILHFKPALFVKYLKLAHEGKRFTPQK